MTYCVCFSFIYYFPSQRLMPTAVPVENGFQTHSTSSSQTNTFDHWVWDVDWWHPSLFFPQIKSLTEFKLATATIAIINFALFLMPGSPYWLITVLILGKLYSNMMMAVLNSRIVLKTQDESNDTLVANPGVSRRLRQGGILVAREQWTTPVDIYLKE